jgi:hypothetical protein
VLMGSVGGSLKHASRPRATVSVLPLASYVLVRTLISSKWRFFLPCDLRTRMCVMGGHVGGVCRGLKQASCHGSHGSYFPLAYVLVLISTYRGSEANPRMRWEDEDVDRAAGAWTVFAGA